MNNSLNCVGCGFCCTQVICRMGSMLYGHYTNPCPALARRNDRHVCTLYLSDPARYEGILAIGEGCCFPDNPLRRDITKEVLSHLGSRDKP
ncbi:MAG: hypothetical protein RDU20_00110 [Desulfomonilaceae bacterium]|nr:hypothetical protein [Desulfomonilaceae bacterium]